MAGRSRAPFGRGTLGQSSYRSVGGSPAQGAYAVAWPVNRFGFIPKPSESIWHHSVGIEIVAMLPPATSKLQLLMLWGRSPPLLIDGQFILTNSGNTLCVSFPSASFIKSCSRKLLFSRLLTAIAGLATGEAGRESE